MKYMKTVNIAAIIIAMMNHQGMSSFLSLVSYKFDSMSACFSISFSPPHEISCKLAELSAVDVDSHRPLKTNRLVMAEPPMTIPINPSIMRFMGYGRKFTHSVPAVKSQPKNSATA